MDWLINLFTTTDSVAHIALLYSVVIAIGVYLGKIKIGGSDAHHALQPVLSGMSFETKPADVFELISLIREGKGKILKIENCYKG